MKVMIPTTDILYITEGKQSLNDSWEYIRVFTDPDKAIRSDDGGYRYFRVYQYLVADKHLILDTPIDN